MTAAPARPNLSVDADTDLASIVDTLTFKGHMLRYKIPAFIQIAALCLAGICGGLAWMALTERQLTTAGRTGIRYHEGTAAVFGGLLWLAGSFGFVGSLALYSRFKRLIWLVLALCWVGLVTWYLMFVEAGNAL